MAEDAKFFAADLDVEERIGDYLQLPRNCDHVSWMVSGSGPLNPVTGCNGRNVSRSKMEAGGLFQHLAPFV